MDKQKSRADKDFEGHECSGILASIVCLIALNCDVASNSRPAAVVVEIPQITSMRRRRHARPPPSAKGLEMSVNYRALFHSYLTQRHQILSLSDLTLVYPERENVPVKTEYISMKYMSS